MSRTVKKGIKIKAKVEGIQKAKIPVKAVVYTEEKERIRILATVAVEKDEFELELELKAEDMPETSRIAVIPDDIKPTSLIHRMVKAGHAPSANISREYLLSKEGRLEPTDLPLKPIFDVVKVWPLKRKVCGVVVKRDPITGDTCPVPGAKVTVLDVDLHLFWWYPYPGYPWIWIYPLRPRREEIATVTTDECGRFCVDIPYFDIDAILRWRLQFRCLWEILEWPRVIDAIDLGIKPDLRFYPEFEILPELEPKPIPEPRPGPIISDVLFRASEETNNPYEKSSNAGKFTSRIRKTDSVSNFYTKPEFDLSRRAVLSKQVMFERVDPAKPTILDQRAFPVQIPPPPLPDDDTLLRKLPDSEMLAELRLTSPILRLLRCWAEFIPEVHLFLDVPDIVFKVEQDIDGDGVLETIYDQGYFDVNWNLTDPTMNIVIEAKNNAICVPCGPSYQPCTTTGFVGISDMPVDSAYLSAQGYAKRVNRPKPNGIRPDAETPFCKTVRLVGCPDYGNASFYKVFYSLNTGPEAHFKESWYVYDIGAAAPHHVVPDVNGFYTVLTPPNNYFPYHTIINWRTYNYPNGKYKIRLALYDSAKNPITASLPEIHVFLDNSKPSRADFLKLEYRESGGTWQNVSIYCPVIKRNKNKDIDLRLQYNAAATHLRDYIIRFRGCGQIPLTTWDFDYWHHTVHDNNIAPPAGTWTVTVPNTVPEGGYRFYLEVRSRAFNGVDGLATNWYIDAPVHIRRGNTLPVVILNKN